MTPHTLKVIQTTGRPLHAQGGPMPVQAAGRGLAGPPARPAVDILERWDGEIVSLRRGLIVNTFTASGLQWKG